MDQDLTLYRAPEGVPVNSFPITLIDGTGSMGQEYEKIIEAYNSAFSTIEQREEYQWEEALYNLLPFQSAWRGNITKTMTSIFTKLISNKGKYPDNITIIFVSDGQEEFSLEQLSNLIEELKTIYLVQFISVAVGSQFPNEISNKLRLKLHNQDPGLRDMYFMERDYNQSDEMIYETAINIFSEIKKQLIVQGELIELDEPVFPGLGSQPKTRVVRNQFFLKPGRMSFTINNLTMKPTDSVQDLQKFIIDSIQQEIIKYSATRNDQDASQISKQFEEINLQAEKLIEKGNFVGEINEEQQQKFQAASDFLQEVASGNIELNELSEENLTKLQVQIATNPQNINLVVDIVTTNQQGTTDQQKIQQNAKKKMRNLGCFIQSKTQKQEKVAIEKASNIFLDTLKQYKNKFEKEQPKNCLQLLKEFNEFIFPQLEELFEKLDITKVGEELYDQLRLLNNTLKAFDNLKYHKVEISWQQACKFIETVTEADSIAQSNAVFDQTDEFQYLPNAIKSQLIQSTNQDLEKILVVIFDQNQSMNQENNIAVATLQNKLNKFEQNTIFQLGFQEGKYYFLDKQETKFSTLIESLNQLKDFVRQKRIYLCYVSDGEIDYQKFHKDIKASKVTFIISLIYLAVGSKFKFTIQNEINEKMHNRDVKGKPILKSIPRKKVTQFDQTKSLISSSTALNIDSQFDKIWEEIYVELFQQKQQKIGQNMLKQLF